MPAESNNELNHWRYQRRNFVGGMIHALFFRLGMAFSQVTSVLPAFIFALTGSNFWVGLLSTLQRTAVVFPQLFFANFLQARSRKKPYLLGVIYFRSAVWLFLAITTFYLGTSRPHLLAVFLILFIMSFFLAGGLGELIYSYLIASTISPTMRGRFMGGRAVLGGIAGIIAGYISRQVLAAVNTHHFTQSYGTLFLLTSLSIAIAGTGFWVMREPRLTAVNSSQNLKNYLKDAFALVKEHTAFQRLLLVTFLIAGMYVALPFYVIFAKVHLGIRDATIGIYVTLQLVGDSLGGLLWGWMGDRRGYRLVLIGIAAVTLVIPLWAIVTGLWFPIAFPATFAFSGMVFRNMRIATRNYLFEIAPEQMVPTYLALKNTLTAPSLLFPLIGGGIARWGGYQVLFIVTALVAIGCIIMSIGLPEPRTPPESTFSSAVSNK